MPLWIIFLWIWFSVSLVGGIITTVIEDKPTGFVVFVIILIILGLILLPLWALTVLGLFLVGTVGIPLAVVAAIFIVIIFLV